MLIVTYLIWSVTELDCFSFLSLWIIKLKLLVCYIAYLHLKEPNFLPTGTNNSAAVHRAEDSRDKDDEI